MTSKKPDSKQETPRRRDALTAIGLFWQTSDSKWHFSEGVSKRGDIHDNGRPIHVAYLGEKAK